MSRKHFSLLLAITVIVAVLVLLLPGRTGRESHVEKSPLLPELQPQVNELDWLRVTGAGGETIVTLRRGDDFWRVEEARGYRADWSQLKILLTDLAQAEVVERKTANPDYYERLGVEDVSEPTAAGVMVEFDKATGLPAVVIGNRAGKPDGHYVRLQGAAESFLIDRSLEVPKDRAAWLDSSIIHIADSEVVAVEIVHPDGERVVARKTSADDENFALQEIPEGREIQSAWTVNSLANGLASLTLEEVVPDSDIDWGDTTHFGIVTADGLRVDADLRAVAAGDEGQADSAYWIRLQASLYQTALDGGVESSEDSSQTTERAATVNRRVSGWAYRIPKYKFDGMTKRMGDLLKAVDASDA